MRYALYCIALVVIGFDAFLLVPTVGTLQQNYGAPQQAVISNLPNPALTPGMANPTISQTNIKQNICKKGWSTKSIRPPSSYTTQLKVRQIKQYGFSDTNTADYEEDHLISLELGGNPTNSSNLWPEAYSPTPGAHQKDAVENYLHSQVCSGQITLKEAQTEISTNWLAVYNAMNTDTIDE